MTYYFVEYTKNGYTSKTLLQGKDRADNFRAMQEKLGWAAHMYCAPKGSAKQYREMNDIPRA